MAKINAGVYTCDNNTFEVELEDGTFASPAELITFTVSIDNSTENWTSYDAEGWETELVTGKKLSVTMKCKRVVGDEVQEALADLLLAKGTAARKNVKATFADGRELAFEANVKITNMGANGEATAVADFEVEFTANGKPTLTKAE